MTEENGIKIHCKFDEMKPIDDIKFNPRNRNSHPDEQLIRLGNIYRHNGVRKCAVISKQSGLVTCGHGRVLTARKVGMKHYPVVYQDYDSPQHEYDDMVADNGVALFSDLDMDAIRDDIKTFKDHDIEMLGIPDFVLPDDEDFIPLIDDDEIPEPKEPKCKTGEVYKLGDHRLMCGDSTDEKSISSDETLPSRISGLRFATT